MEDSAQKAIHNLDQEMEQATNDLHKNVGESLNKSGLPDIPRSLDPQHQSTLEEIKHKGEEVVRDVFRVGGQMIEGAVVGTHHDTNLTESNKPLSLGVDRQSKKAEEELKKAA